MSALPKAELIDLLEQIGFEGVEVTHRYDTFRGTSKERTARKFGVTGVNVFARKPDRRGT